MHLGRGLPASSPGSSTSTGWTRCSTSACEIRDGRMMVPDRPGPRLHPQRAGARVDGRPHRDRAGHFESVTTSCLIASADAAGCRCLAEPRQVDQLGAGPRPSAGAARFSLLTPSADLVVAIAGDSVCGTRRRATANPSGGECSCPSVASHWPGGNGVGRVSDAAAAQAVHRDWSRTAAHLKRGGRGRRGCRISERERRTEVGDRNTHWRPTSDDGSCSRAR